MTFVNYLKHRKNLFRSLLILFYLLAGINHFINPEFYYPLIPPYFPKPTVINFFAGTIEILFSIGVAVPRWRKGSVIFIIVMLIAFIPSHMYFIQEGACMSDGGLCTPMWVAWFRLIIVHPILIAWAWYVK